VCAFVAIIALSGRVGAAFENLPAGFDGRELVSRLAARGLLPVDAAVSLPLPRSYGLPSALPGAGSLSLIERSHLAAYGEYGRPGAPGSVWRHAADGFALTFDPRVEFEAQRWADGGGVATATSFRPVAYGGTSAFRFFTEFEWGVVSNARSFRFPPDKFPLRQKSITGDLEQLSMAQGHIAFGSGPMVAQIGKIPVRWGMATRGSLLLSDNTDAKDGVRLLVRTGPFRFESLTAAMPQVGVTKYISAHRLSVRPHSRLVVGVHEAVVYTGALRLNYLNPFNVYLMSVPIVERQTRGDDRGVFPGGNTLLGADVTVRVGESSLLYIDSVVDDYQPQRGLQSLRNWDSKFAVQVGAYTVDPFGVSDMSVVAEYAFVNQYAYTHEFDPLRYTLGGEPLGFFTGPDADDLFLGAVKWLSPRLRLHASFAQTRKGEQRITEPHVRSGPERWTFLSGVEEVRRAVGVGVRLTEVTRWWLDVGAEYVRVLDAGHVAGDDGAGIDVSITGAYRL
jgi:hypothetical protein